MKLKIIFLKIYLIGAIALSGCSTYNNTSSNYDKSVDFTKYKTYAWLDSQKSRVPTAYYNDVIENNAKSYIDQNLKNRGYTVDTINPDVLMELVLKSKKKTEEIQVSNPYNYSNHTYYSYTYNPYYDNNPYFDNQYYNRYPNYNNGTHYSSNIGYRTKTMKYTEITTTINMIDRDSNKLVWTGSAKKDIYDPRYFKDEIHPAIVNIMGRYPVKAIKNK